MRVPESRIRVPLVLLLAACATAGVVQARASLLAAPPAPLAAPPPDEPVQFTQLNWLDDGGAPLVPFSKVGVAELSFSNTDAQLLQQSGGGYVNIVTDAGRGPQWSVENLYLTYPDLDYLLVSHPTVQFDMGVPDGIPVDTMGWSLTITPQPLPAPQNPFLVFSPVRHEDYLVGGLDRGGSGVLAIVQSIGPFVGCHAADCAPPQFIAMTPAPAALAVAPVDEGKMGCAPAGVARSLKYMFGSGALQGVDVQGIYEELYGLMGTNPTTGTDNDAIKKGKKDYAKRHKLDIQTNGHDFKNGVRFASDGLPAGADVEILIKWPNGKGHLAMVTSIVSLGEKKGYQIKYVDDPTQGDGKSENKEHTITVDKDGNITSGGGGKVDGFIVETKKK